MKPAARNVIHANVVSWLNQVGFLRVFAPSSLTQGLRCIEGAVGEEDRRDEGNLSFGSGSLSIVIEFIRHRAAHLQWVFERMPVQYSVNRRGRRSSPLLSLPG